jgi:hypothetical protein
MKRGRGADYFGGDASSRRKYYGIKRAIAFGKQYPLSKYSYSPMLRGSPESLSAYGSSWKTATPEQRALRKQMMMSGPGLYKGRGGFFGGLAGLLTGQGWKKGSDFGDKVWDTVKGGVATLPYGAQIAKAMEISDMINPAAQAIATHAGKGLYKGRGAYATNNLIMDGGATASNVVPVFNPSDMHSITYSNREYVRDIFAPASGTVFSLQSWSLNPGLADSFPWLSQIAINFEEYEIIQLAYTYKSTVADFAASSGQVGQVVMATQYNPNSDPFADKEEMMLYEGGMSCKTTESLVHGVECDPSKIAGAAQKYVRAGSLPPTEDLKNYDLGRTSIAVLNAPSTYAGQQLGELWVSYTVRLRKPKLAAGNAYNIRRDAYVIKQSTPVSTTRLATPTNFLIGARNSIGGSLDVNYAGLNTPTGASSDTLSAATVTNNATTQPYDFAVDLNSYSGILRVRVITYCNTINGFVIPDVVTASPTTILRFQDIPQAGGWTHAVKTTDAIAAGTLYWCDTEIHIRVLPPTEGRRNILYFVNLGYSYNTSYQYQMHVEITQYNSFLSYQDNGSNDKIQLTLQDGTPATFP